MGSPTFVPAGSQGKEMDARCKAACSSLTLAVILIFLSQCHAVHNHRGPAPHGTSVCVCVCVCVCACVRVCVCVDQTEKEGWVLLPGCWKSVSLDCPHPQRTHPHTHTHTHTTHLQRRAHSPTGSFALVENTKVGRACARTRIEVQE